jgi:DNA-directed RNA polymerase I subunit RPA49
MEARKELGQTFGTKKAKKAIQDMEINAIAPSKNTDGTPKTLGRAEKALMAEIGETAATMASREALEAMTNAARPVPPANDETDDIHEVYDPNVIIGKDILAEVPIRDWQEAARKSEDVLVISRFVAKRINKLATNSGTEDRLRLLRYLYLLIQFYTDTKPGMGKLGGSRKIPPRKFLLQRLAPAPETVIDHITRKFSDGRAMSKFHVDLLMTHACAFACIIDSFEVDIWELQQDLKLDEKHMTQYFRQIGARIKKKTSNGNKSTIAELSLPLDLPKLGRGLKRRRKFTSR